MDVGKVVDHMTWESCIPTDSVKSGDDYSSLIHSIRTGAEIDQVRPIRHTLLVRVMKCRVGNIRVKRGQSEVWITICIGIIIIVIHNTKMSGKNKNKQTNTQRKRKFQKQAYTRLT